MWLYVPLVVVHVIVAVALVLTVLLQAGKGSGIGAAFGGASQTVFGPRGPGNFLSKLTTAAAVIFMGTSLMLAVFSSRYVGGSVVLTAPAPTPADVPASPMTPRTPGDTGTTQIPPTPESGGDATQEQN